MQSHVIIPEADISSAVLEALKEIEQGMYDATQDGIQVIFDKKVDFQFVVIRSANGVTLNNITSRPQVAVTQAEVHPEIETVTLREEDQDKTTVTDTTPEDETVTVENNPEVASESIENHPLHNVVDTEVHDSVNNSVNRGSTSADTTSTKSGGDGSTVNREYDEY